MVALMTVQTARLSCVIAGVPTELLSADTQFGVDQPVGTATLTFAAPVPAHVTRNAVVELQAGYVETTGLLRRFAGRIVSRHVEYSGDGKTARVACAGWATLLAFPDQADLIYSNASRPWAIFRSLATRRKVPAFSADNVRYLDGVTDIRFGGNPLVDGGNVIIQRRTSPLDWLASAFRLLGYRLFDRPDGVTMVQRVSGIPPAAAATHVEALDLVEASHDDTLEGYVTYWEVLGARYTDADGVNVAIRSIPASVPYAAELDPPGYRADSVSDDRLVTQALADYVRNVREIDTGAPSVHETYRVAADPSLLPGMAVHLTSATLGVDAVRWITGLRETFSADGYWQTLDTWSGGGTALPAGNDAVTVSVATGPVHLGDEWIGWYAHPAPQGKTYSFPLTVPDDYTAIVLTLKAHGCNSYLLDGANSDSTVSKIEVWQGGDKPVGTAQLPVLAENYDRRLDYTNLANWTAVRMPVPGSLTAGPAEVRIISGEDTRLPDSTKAHDFELRDIALTLSGVGMPVLPGEAT